MLRSTPPRFKTQVSFGVVIVLGTLLAMIGAELLLEYLQWAPQSSGATNGLKIYFSADTLYRNESTIHLEVDRIKGRSTGKGREQNTSLPHIYFYGDSMTFGAGVAAHETFASYVQNAMDREVVVRNFGVIGYGPDQATKLALDSSSPHGSTIGVLTLFSGNDFRDLLSNKLISCKENLCAWSDTHILSPFLSTFRLVNLVRGGIMGRDAIPASVISELFNDTEVSFTALSGDDQELTKAQLSFALSEFSRIFGRNRTLIVVLPPLTATTSPDDSAKESHRVTVSIATGLGIKTIDLAHVLKPASYLPNDHHLNAEGHKGVGTALVPELKDIVSKIEN